MHQTPPGSTALSRCLLPTHTLRGMLTPWDAPPPSEPCPTCSRQKPLQRACPKGGNRKRIATVCPPQELHNAVKHLSDGELDLMHAATLEELKRRGRTPKSVETDLPARPDLTKTRSPPTKTAKLKAANVSLTRGQVNAVRSAFKAGITPSRISREFGIPLSDVRQALARDKTKR
jgi:hypothetical protein